MPGDIVHFQEGFMCQCLFFWCRPTMWVIRCLERLYQYAGISRCSERMFKQWSDMITEIILKQPLRSWATTDLGHKVTLFCKKPVWRTSGGWGQCRYIRADPAQLRFTFTHVVSQFWAETDSYAALQSCNSGVAAVFSWPASYGWLLHDLKSKQKPMTQILKTNKQIS